MTRPIIYLGADHNGFGLKERIKRWLRQRGLTRRDLGAARLAPGDDYPDYAAAVARAVAAGKGEGLLICGSGHGMAIAANRFRGVRATLCLTPESARRARHEDRANVLVLAARETSWPQAQRILQTWLKTPFSRAVRHRRRVTMIEKSPNSKFQTIPNN